MYPSIEMVKDLSKSYRRVPVCTTMLSDPYTPVELLRILRKSSRHCYLLESASQDEQWGRYSFLGYDPTMEITCTNGYLTIRKIEQDEIAEHHVRHPHTILRDILKRYHSPILDEMPPFTGGLVGYFAYDYIKYGEPKLHLDDGQSDFKDMDLMVFDSVIALDHYQQRIYLITGVDTGDVESSYQNAQKRLNAMKTLLKQNDKKEFPPIKLQSKLTPKFNRSEFCSLVEDAKHYIYEGDIFQVVLSNPMQAKATGSLFDTYRILRASNPSPYMFYLSSDDIELVGASPETLVKLENKKLFTFPLAGTRPRGKNKDEDLKLEKELLSDEKERAASMIEAYCDAVNQEIIDIAGHQGFYCRPRFSPGYGDFSLAYQKDFGQILQMPKTIGVTLTHTLLMVPSKSVTAIIGCSKSNNSCVIQGCEVCDNATHCEFRRETGGKQ